MLCNSFGDQMGEFWSGPKKCSNLWEGQKPAQGAEGGQRQSHLGLVVWISDYSLILNSILFRAINRTPLYMSGWRACSFSAVLLSG